MRAYVCAECGVLGSVADLDTRSCLANWPHGPLVLVEGIGADVVIEAANAIEAHQPEPWEDLEAFEVAGLAMAVFLSEDVS